MCFFTSSTLGLSYDSHPLQSFILMNYLSKITRLTTPSSFFFTFTKRKFHVRCLCLVLHSQKVFDSKASLQIINLTLSSNQVSSTKTISSNNVYQGPSSWIDLVTPPLPPSFFLFLFLANGSIPCIIKNSQIE